MDWNERAELEADFNAAADYRHELWAAERADLDKEEAMMCEEPDMAEEADIAAVWAARAMAASFDRAAQVIRDMIAVEEDDIPF